MSYDDFKKNWVNLEICNLGPDVMEEVYQMTGAKLNQGQGWTCAEHDGAWICGVTAGGCRNKIGTYPLQLLLLIHRSSELFFRHFRHQSTI